MPLFRLSCRSFAAALAAGAIVAGAPSTQARAAGMTLVEDGRAHAVLVVEAGSPKALQSAEALQTYLERMSGARLPLVGEGEALPDDAPPGRIHVGHTAAARGQNVPSGYDRTIRADLFEEEGYVLRTLDANALLVAGNNDGPYAGTIYAAYALLERLGCRWFFPGEWGEVIPERRTVTVPPLDVVSRPDFAVRGVSMLGWASGEDRRMHNEWCVKVGMLDNHDRPMYPVAGDGFLAMLLPPAEYAESHPKFYAVNKQGQRTVTPKTGVHHTMLCMSNPDVLAESVKNLRLAFAGEKRIGAVSDMGVGLSPPDGTPFCYCDGCLKASQNFRFPEYYAERFMSEEFAAFVAALAREFPDKLFTISSYALREMPPQGVDLPPNVAVTIWPLSACVLHAGDDPGCWRRWESMRIAEAWRRLTPHVVLNRYNPGLMNVYGAGHRSYVPERAAANFAAEAPLMKAMGLKGSFDQGCSGYLISWISYYLKAKLLWDANADVEALKDDFYTTFFGPAAGPHVRAWWDACEAELGAARNHAHEDFLVNHIYTAEFAGRIRPHADAACAAEAEPAQRKRLETFALIAEHLDRYAEMNEAMKRLDYAAAATANERMTAIFHELDAIYPLFVDKKWSIADRLRKVAARMDGSAGDIVAPLPLKTRFARDPFNEGILAGWYRPEFDDSDWGAKNTFYTWEQQDPPESARGHSYAGYGWYRADVEVDGTFANRPIRLFVGGAINEAWVWVNGRYVGHRAHKLWWNGAEAHRIDLDVTDAVRPGQPNTIAIRILKDADAGGGLYERGFLYSPVAAAE